MALNTLEALSPPGAYSMITGHRHAVKALDRPSQSLESRCSEYDVLSAARKHSISGLVAEYIVAIDVTWARFPADACLLAPRSLALRLVRSASSSAIDTVSWLWRDPAILLILGALLMTS